MSHMKLTNKVRRLSAVAAVVLLLAGCVSPTPAAVSPVTGMPEGTQGFPWWNDSVFYEIFVRSFYDSNNDGVGDFNGLTEKLDYLNDGNPETTIDLGMTGIWLMPSILHRLTTDMMLQITTASIQIMEPWMISSVSWMRLTNGASVSSSIWC